MSDTFNGDAPTSTFRLKLAHAQTMPQGEVEGVWPDKLTRASCSR
jgi:hypothetical protein